ncbi:unnamed protein product [Cuscuta europaea]|uniref:protein-ribulosamine 3-kinase n=1 Tax=Cuscuta europaea TaxID=41803 RepID=A0A9P0ZDS3_CUSEU|nr:unnamed protein product [Cuscuta europaea]
MLIAQAGLIPISSSISSANHCPRFRFSSSKQYIPFLVAATMMGDDPIREWILSEGNATKIKGVRSIGGGCINNASCYDTDAGPFFVKSNRSFGPSMFEGEAVGLNAMLETHSIRVPKPYKVGSLPTAGSYFIMEFIEFGASKRDQSALGRKLAEMHKSSKSEMGFGFHVDNTIGSTPQINKWTQDWIDFYAEHRLVYQLQLAREHYADSTIYQKGQKLARNLRLLFQNVVIEPCLLHGDLWSGNIAYDKNGEPVILDPACYCEFLILDLPTVALYHFWIISPECLLVKDQLWNDQNTYYVYLLEENKVSKHATWPPFKEKVETDGHNEAEFGMSWCAGFGAAFYNAYFEVMHKQSGFEERKDLYMLYHYLNHYNMFGSGYRSSAMSIIDDYLRMLNL